MVIKQSDIAVRNGITMEQEYTHTHMATYNKALKQDNRGQCSHEYMMPNWIFVWKKVNLDSIQD